MSADEQHIRQLHSQYPIFNDLIDAIVERLQEASDLLEVAGRWVPGDVSLYAPIVDCVRDQVKIYREGSPDDDSLPAESAWD